MGLISRSFFATPLLGPKSNAEEAQTFETPFDSEQFKRSDASSNFQGHPDPTLARDPSQLHLLSFQVARPRTGVGTGKLNKENKRKGSRVFQATLLLETHSQ